VDISYLDMKFNDVKTSVIHTGSCFNCPSFASLVVEIDLTYLIIYVLTLGLMYTKVSFILLSTHGGYMNEYETSPSPGQLQP